MNFFYLFFNFYENLYRVDDSRATRYFSLTSTRTVPSTRPGPFGLGRVGHFFERDCRSLVWYPDLSRAHQSYRPLLCWDDYHDDSCTWYVLDLV